VIDLCMAIKPSTYTVLINGTTFIAVLHKTSCVAGKPRNPNEQKLSRAYFSESEATVVTVRQRSPKEERWRPNLHCGRELKCK